MRDLPTLIIVNVSSGLFLFAVTWGLTRKFSWPVKAVCAGAGWLLLAVVEGGYWAFNQIDYYNPRPCSPLLVSSYVVFSALWLLVALPSGMARSRAKKGAKIIAGGAVALGVVVVAQWPWEGVVSSNCKYHLRNQYLALHWYADDHDGRLPSSPGTGWARLTKPYYTYRSDLLKCPADHGMCDTSYLLTPEAAGKPFYPVMAPGLDKQVVLLEASPRHRGKAHAILGNGEMIEVTPKSGRISQ